MPESLGPQERIRKRKDFLAIYGKGKRYRAKYFNFVYLPNDSNFSRLAVVVGRKIGNAVTRNRAKRWIRTLFRRNKELVKPPMDIIIIANQNINNATWPLLQDDYWKAIKSISQ